VIENTIGKLKAYKSSGTEQIPAELIQAGDNTLHSEVHEIINYILRREELPHNWKESGCSNYGEISLLPTAY
jgi:hypothetical protein